MNVSSKKLPNLKIAPIPRARVNPAANFVRFESPAPAAENAPFKSPPFTACTTFTSAPPTFSFSCLFISSRPNFCSNAPLKSPLVIFSITPRVFSAVFDASFSASFCSSKTPS